MHTFHLERQAACKSDYGYIYTAFEGLISAGEDPEARSLLEKLSHPALPGAEPDGRIFLDFGAALEERETPQKLRKLELATQQKRTVSFGYRDAKGKKTQSRF